MYENPRKVLKAIANSLYRYKGEELTAWDDDETTPLVVTRDNDNIVICFEKMLIEVKNHVADPTSNDNYFICSDEVIFEFYDGDVMHRHLGPSKIIFHRFSFGPSGNVITHWVQPIWTDKGKPINQKPIETFLSNNEIITNPYAFYNEHYIPDVNQRKEFEDSFC